MPLASLLMYQGEEEHGLKFTRKKEKKPKKKKRNEKKRNEKKKKIEAKEDVELFDKVEC